MAARARIQVVPDDCDSSGQRLQRMFMLRRGAPVMALVQVGGLRAGCSVSALDGQGRWAAVDGPAGRRRSGGGSTERGPTEASTLMLYAAARRPGEPSPRVRHHPSTS